MTFTRHLLAATALAFLSGAVSAAPDLITVERDMGGPVFGGNLGFDGLTGYASFDASEMLVVALNLTSAQVAAVPDASMQITTRTTSSGRVNYQSVGFAAPLVALSGQVEGDGLTVRSLQADGGIMISTVKNPATKGSGWLSISDLKVDLSTKTIYADLEGDRGVGVLNDYALWTYDTVSGPVNYQPPPVNLTDMTLLPPSLTFSGLFLTNAADIDNIFVQALNLNNTGRAGFNATNTRTATRTTGFGSLTISAVPEPGAVAMLCGGLMGLALFARRRGSTGNHAK